MLNVKLLTLLFHLLSHITYASTLPPTVKTPNGTLTGLHNPHYAQDLFLGIPYAQPPIGPLRYRRPASLAQPYDSFDATRYGPGCHSAPVKVPVFTQNQPPHPESEDCLTLNIIRPAGLGSRDTKLPVLVFIHGGGFQEGSSGDQRYNMSFLVQESVDVGAPIIGVSINYRLSGFGFLPGSAVLESNVANLGLHDQRLALWWVKENIAAFGGDEDKVTIHGESAGAMSVGYHLLAYGGRDESLFRAAIVQSGGPANFARGMSVRAQDGFYDDLLGQTGCMLAEDSLDCLRGLPAEVLKAVFQDQTLLPVQDGDFFDGNSRVALKRGRFVRRPMLAGANTNEGTSFTIGSGLSVSHGVASTTVDGIAAEYLERMSPEELQAALGTVLPSSRAEYGGLYGRATLFVGDHIFMAARRLGTEMWAEYGVPAYSYRFDTVPGGVSPETLGAAHFAEIPFVFGNVDGVGHEVNFLASDSTEEREEFVRLSKRMSRMWLSFANELSPNAHYALDDDTIWPAYIKGSARNVVFGKIGIGLEEDTWRANAITRMNSAAVGLEA
ncbi:carotenoid ester lipase-like protein precursor [Alternaria rosae]|uniref:carotenoid ester lipase-like protein precursor n=1 Tax=Alternaria rosae TaxID=1187941 RepID=UPI001E8D7806|nr:carotenoid ester lipase-like protein precursor [Alternaria rosae]KAH6883326.1 carotenoid ester lipase-like protein precursor [Alternaria rosae]